MSDPRLEELDAALKMGVRVEQPLGEPLTDYHTTTGVLPTADGDRKGKPEDPSTIVSRRAYLQDAAFLVVLGGEAGLLQRTGAALTQPRWPLFLGRKSCPPVRPIFDEID